MSVVLQMEYLGRIGLACVCGALIGYERNNRMKTAGLRTHMIVSLAAALMMVVSKYGFFDILARDNIGLDPSRIAAGVVTAIGFLGAGIIFVHHQNVSGLTTAAGIWATVGVGMCVGAGLYLLGIFSTLILLVIQMIFHRNIRWIKSPTVETMTLEIKNDPNAVSQLESVIKDDHIEFLNLSIKKINKEVIQVKLELKLPESYDIYEAVKRLVENEEIISIEI